MNRNRKHALLAAALLFAATPALPAGQSYKVRYDASLYGLPIGRAMFESRFEGDGFAVSGSFASAGVARLFDRTDGTIAVNGWLSESGSRPHLYTLAYRDGKRDQQKRTVIRFDRGTVVETRNEPEPKKRADDWIPVTDRHLAGVADPISALLLPVANPAQVCNRRVPLYFGDLGADVILRPAAASDRFSRAEVTCQARVQPISGYRKGRRSIADLRDRTRILVGFRAVEGQKLYSPVEATIATKIGTVHIRARPM
jgi:hypothetical protein